MGEVIWSSYCRGSCCRKIIYSKKETQKGLKDWYLKRGDFGEFGHAKLLRELRRENERLDFRNFLRLDNETHDYLLEMIEPLNKTECNKNASARLSDFFHCFFLHIFLYFHSLNRKKKTD